MAVSVQKVGPKGQVTLPKQVRVALGLKTGALVETVLTRDGALTRPVEIRPKKVDVEQELEAAMADVAAGRVHGPFKTAGAVLRAAKRHGRRARIPRQ
jgi:AbrB family looped-hinge helix DNA binding protein